jgi:translation initiation factor 2B subunit (eIF-2B alpha/beta/delta family)
MTSRTTLQHRESYNALLKTLEHDFGTRGACIAFLQAFTDSLRQTRFRSADHLRQEMADFGEFFPHLQPRMAIIQHYVDRVTRASAKTQTSETAVLINELEAAIRCALEENACSAKQLTKKALSLIYNGCTILIHSRSHTVLDVLIAAKAARKNFRVIVAEQEACITHEIVAILSAHGIPFVVVPEYMLSEVESDISFMLIGAVTLKQEQTLVVHAGTKPIVAEFNAAHVPVYALLTTDKFSFWQTRSNSQTVKSVKSQSHPTLDCQYERLKFSHDRLPIALLQKIVTERGVATPDELMKLHRELQVAYDRQQEHRAPAA